MATKLKNDTKNKGLLILTHKELQWFRKLSIIELLILMRIKKYFFLGMHWGNFRENVRAPRFIDFHMAGKGTLSFKKKFFKDPLRIDLCSRNFLSFPYGKTSLEKKWDILNISRPIAVKKLDLFLKAIKQVYVNGGKPSVLLVCSAPEDFSDSKKYSNMYVNLLRDYESMFSEEERQLFKIEFRADKAYPFSFTKKEIESFYLQSRIFSLFSDIEGESRVISEALWFGLPVVAWRGLKGGGLDYLNEKNSELFTDYSNAHAAFEKLLSKNIDHTSVSLGAQKEFASEFSIKKLNIFLNELYKNNGETFDGLDFPQDLDRALPGHLNIIPEDLTNKVTDDFNSFKSLVSYLNKNSERLVSDKIYRTLAKLF